MWTSRQADRQVERPPSRRNLDALGLAVALAFIPELIGGRAGVAIEPHPGWITVLVLAARYGSAGLFTGLIAAACAAAIGTTVAGAGLAAWASRLDSGPNLMAFGACLAVSCAASWHLRRQEDLGERLSAVSDRAARAEAAIEAFRCVVAKLRARVDRTSTSLSFLRDVAARLEGADPVAAAEGAADLALVRTGARAAAVEVRAGEFRRFLSVRDAGVPRALVSPARRDADLTVPIMSGNDRVGVIALWGIPPSGLDDATARDLAVIASWCGPSLAFAAWRPEQVVGRVRAIG